MTTRKRKERDPSTDSFNTTDPTATWKTNVRPNKSFAFSRRTKMIASSSNDSHPSRASGGQGFKRFQKGRSKFRKETACDPESRTDPVEKNPASQEQKSLNPGENNKGIIEKSRRDVGLVSAMGEQGCLKSSFSCRDQKKKSISCEIPSSELTDNKMKAKILEIDSDSSSSSKTNKPISSAVVNCHHLLPRTNTNFNPVPPHALEDHLPNACCKTGCMEMNIKRGAQTITKSKNDDSNKNSPSRHIGELNSNSFLLPKANATSNSDRESSINNDRASIDNSQSTGFNTKSEAKKPKESTPKVQHKKCEEDFHRQPTPFVCPNLSIAPKNGRKVHTGTKPLLQHGSDHEHVEGSSDGSNTDVGDLLPKRHGLEAIIESNSHKNLDRFKKDEEYGCNRFECDEELSSHESKNVDRLKLYPSPLLKQSNCLNLSINAPSILGCGQSCGQRCDGEEQEKESNIPTTFLSRNQTETSTDIMGLSPLAEFRRRAASVDEGFYDTNSPSSTDATTGLVPKEMIRHKYSLRKPNVAFYRQSTQGMLATGDGYIQEYYSKRTRNSKNIIKPKPKQLLDDFNAVSAKSVPKTRKRNFGYPPIETSIPDNDVSSVKNLADDELGVTYSARVDQNGIIDNVTPKYALGKSGENRINIGSKEKEHDVFTHPLRLDTTILDQMISAALESQKRFSKSKNSKTSKLNRDVARKGCNSGSSKKSNLVGLEYTHTRVSSTRKRSKESLSDEIKCNTRKSKKHKKARDKLRRVSLESPPMTNRTQHSGALSGTLNDREQKKLIAENDYSLRRLGIDFSDDDSSDWSADWDNLSIKSIPRKRQHPRENNDAHFDDIAHFVEDSSEDEDNNNVSVRHSREGVRRAKSLNDENSEKPREQSAPSGHPSIGKVNPYQVIMYRRVATNENKVIAISRSRSRPTASVVKNIHILAPPSICRIIFLFCIYSLLWATKDECDYSIIRGGTDLRMVNKYRMKRPPIRFSENPSLSLVKASTIHETSLM